MAHISRLTFRAEINGSADEIFDLLADMPNYGKWLPGSPAFGETTDVSPYPVRLGTTYLDKGPAGERPGVVIEYERPTQLSFHQTMAIRKGPISADLDIYKRFNIEPAGDVTNVLCILDLQIEMRGLGAIARPLVVAGFKKENDREIAELKRYVQSMKPPRKAERGGSEDPPRSRFT